MSYKSRSPRVPAHAIYTRFSLSTVLWLDAMLNRLVDTGLDDMCCYATRGFALRDGAVLLCKGA